MFLKRGKKEKKEEKLKKKMQKDVQFPLPVRGPEDRRRGGIEDSAQAPRRL